MPRLVLTDGSGRFLRYGTYDRHMAGDAYGGPNPPRGRQDVLNETWPLVDDKGKRHARGIPNREPIPVTVRVVFESDGETWLDGDADRWHGRCVHVSVIDPRLRVNGVWVDAADVKRR